MDEQLKQQLMPGLVVFNLTVVAWMLFRIFTSARGMFFSELLTQILIGVAIGLVTGGITVAVTMRKK